MDRCANVLGSVLAKYLTVVCFLECRKRRNSASSTGGYGGVGGGSDHTFPMDGEMNRTKMADGSVAGSYGMQGSKAR
jgi:hypothetical protein